MTLTLQPVLLANRHDDEAQFVFVGDRLLGLLVRLSEMHEGLAGSWFLEFAFDDLDHPPNSIFPDLDTALEWIAERLSGQPPN